MVSLKRLFGFSADEDPLKREVEEMRKAAKAAAKSAEKAEKTARKAGGGKGGSRSKEGERRGLSEAVEELESIFAEVSEQL